MRFRKDQKIELLSRVPLLSRCSKRELARIASLADLIEFREGDTLMQEGKYGVEFFVIVDGWARVTRRGRKLAELGAGDWFGEIALLSNVPRTATVRITSDVTALRATRKGFAALLDESPSIQRKVLRALADRIAPTAI